MADNRGAQALRKALAEQKQSELAQITGISQSHISRLAAGEKTPKLLEDALALRDAAGIDPDWWHQDAEPGSAA